MLTATSSICNYAFSGTVNYLAGACNVSLPFSAVLVLCLTLTVDDDFHRLRMVLMVSRGI